MKLLSVKWCMKSPSINSAWLLALLLVLTITFHPANAAVIADKTPANVYAQVQLLASEVKRLRSLNKITSSWPEVKKEAGREPRHVLQKALEILGKINRFRKNVQKTGGISVPRFPGRDITPNEVFSAVVRLRRELALLLKEKKTDIESQVATITTEITPSHVYASLSEISIALDETLGLRGFTPSDVYAQSLRVLELVKFLRQSQNLPMNVPNPERTSGKLSNHALSSVYGLFAKIRQAEENLWMKPLNVPDIPKRVITPVDVFDNISVSLSELQRIKYRLGLERDFSTPPRQTGKTPDDVILNTEWAIAMLPTFELERPLQQHDKKSLQKTPNHVFSVTSHILERLKQYRRLRGIRTPVQRADIIHGLRPHHVYEKGLEILEKIDVIRRSSNQGPITIQEFPLRLITPAEVFDLALRLDEELNILFTYAGMADELWLTSSEVKEFDNKTPSDVFLNMRRISQMLDTVLGSEGYTPSHVFREATSVKDNILIIANVLGTSIVVPTTVNSALEPSIEPRDVFFKAREVMGLVLKAEQRAGMFGVRDISIPPGQVVTPTDVFNQVRIIDAELTELKIFLGIPEVPIRPQIQEGKKPAHVYKMLELAEEGLLSILHLKRKAPPPSLKKETQ